MSDTAGRRAPSTFVISITPFTADGALDEPGLRAHLGRLGDAGIGVYLTGSGSGEGYTLDDADPGEAYVALVRRKFDPGGRLHRWCDAYVVSGDIHAT